MKVVVAWLGLVALALVVAGSCSIKHQSEQYECETNADCADLGENRVCSEGLCVVPGGNMKDAAMGDAPRGDAAIDAAVCPSQCTSCNLEKKECIIDCQANPAVCGNASTNTPVKCPTGFACVIKCNSPSSCRSGVDCTTATRCGIECTGFGSCRGVQCGPGPCDVNCTGSQSCGGIACNTSCACDVECGINANCLNVTCTKAQCDTGLGCSSQIPGCNTCP